MVLEEGNHAKRTGQDGEPTDAANSRCQAVNVAQTLAPQFMDGERSDEITREGGYSRRHRSCEFLLHAREQPEKGALLDVGTVEILRLEIHGAHSRRDSFDVS